MKKLTTQQLVTDAMLAAMCAVLGFISLDMGNLKVTFESLPVLLAAMLFGPLDGMLVGGVGVLLYQILRYGLMVTTPLWVLPYIIAGLCLGLYAKQKHFDLDVKHAILPVFLTEVLLFLLNTVGIYLDSLYFGYYSFAYVFGTIIPRLLLCIAKGVAFGAIVPGLRDTVQKSMASLLYNKHKA